MIPSMNSWQGVPPTTHDSRCYQYDSASWWVAMAFVTVITSVLFIAIITKSIIDLDLPPPELLLVCMPLAWLTYYHWAVISYKVTYWPETGRLEFRSLLRRKEANVREVTSISLTPGNFATLAFKYPGGKTRLLHAIDGISELIHQLRQTNPRIISTRI